jgi:hypothetical protein
MQILNSVFGVINQEVTGNRPFIRTAETSMLAKKYRFIEFFIPGIIAMAVMTATLFGTVNVNTELRASMVFVNHMTALSLSVFSALSMAFQSMTI